MNELAAGRRIRRIDMQKYTFFYTPMMASDFFCFFSCFCPAVPPNLFSILPACGFRGGKI